MYYIIIIVKNTKYIPGLIGIVITSRYFISNVSQIDTSLYTVKIIMLICV